MQYKVLVSIESRDPGGKWKTEVRREGVRTVVDLEERRAALRSVDLLKKVSDEQIAGMLTGDVEASELIADAAADRAASAVLGNLCKVRGLDRILRCEEEN